MHNSFVRQFVSKERPIRTEYGFRHVGPRESGGIHIAYRDMVKLAHDAVREFLLMIIPAIADLGLYRFDALFSSRYATTNATPHYDKCAWL